MSFTLSLLFANTNKLFSHFQIITLENKSLLLFHLRDRIAHHSLRSIPIYSSHRLYFFVEIRGFICSILLHARCLCPRLQSCPPLFSFLPSFDPRSRSCRAAASISFSHFPCHYRGSGLWYYGHRPLMQPGSFKLAGRDNGFS